MSKKGKRKAGLRRRRHQPPRARTSTSSSSASRPGSSCVGTEVKSLREGKAQIGDAYAVIEDGEVWLRNAHIPPYEPASTENHDPERPRKLLLHRYEIERLIGPHAAQGPDADPDPGLLQGPAGEGRAGAGDAASSSTTAAARSATATSSARSSASCATEIAAAPAIAPGRERTGLEAVLLEQLQPDLAAGRERGHRVPQAGERDLADDGDRRRVERLGDLGTDEGRADDHARARSSTTSRDVPGALRPTKLAPAFADGPDVDGAHVEPRLASPAPASGRRPRPAAR